ncbi:MAG: SUMF1/EgtB/PvdO family nonheme iron enzyme [Bacteroidales bacterium]|nr:SUMF1/EgtB/PvdO family nonheme iron enzyme [Bacteroidales bacterium]
MKYFSFLATTVFIGSILLFSACSKQKSATTGWDYNNAKTGGFEVADYRGQITGPGLIFIEGGTFTMGTNYDDPMFEWHSAPRRVTVRSFYMDETEIANVDYLEYLFWVNRVFGTDYPEVYKKALPDTLVWRDRLAYNEPMVEIYLRHPAYHYYPVVGVSWIQASDYCAWRTDRVNEMLLIERGILEMDPDQINENNFNTESYLAGQYEGLVNKNLQDLNPNSTGERRVRLEDGIMLPRYRLPTEAEWEFAALGQIGNTVYERVLDRRIYPWNSHVLRTDEKNYYGSYLGNFKRGKGDYAGVAGDLNDGAIGPAMVGSFWPNDYGLYNMAGNVSEWVLDVYRPLSYEDMTDLNPFRGNIFQHKVRDSEGLIAEKDEFGRLQYDDVPVEDIVNQNRKNYRKADNVNYTDGDFQSTINTEDWLRQTEDSHSSTMYDYSGTTMINDNARVYKGGSWKDNSYWMMPSTRRFLDENSSTDYIGFRCAMDRVGSDDGL